MPEQKLRPGTTLPIPSSIRRQVLELQRMMRDAQDVVSYMECDLVERRADQMRAIKNHHPELRPHTLRLSHCSTSVVVTGHDPHFDPDPGETVRSLPKGSQIPIHPSAQSVCQSIETIKDRYRKACDIAIWTYDKLKDELHQLVEAHLPEVVGHHYNVTDCVEIYEVLEMSLEESDAPDDSALTCTKAPEEE